jgi:hypothetical protein
LREPEEYSAEYAVTDKSLPNVIVDFPVPGEPFTLPDAFSDTTSPEAGAADTLIAICPVCLPATVAV